MKVFLVPVGPTRHVPYCEPGDGPHGAPVDDGRGLRAELARRYREVVAAAEHSRLTQDAQPDTHPGGWLSRAKAWVLRWIADRITEQRLLWQLRTCEAATLLYPADLSEDEAQTLLRRELNGDGDRHRRWLVVNAALLVGSGIFAILPGPNLIAYYFAFRVVGHYLSFRGARNGLERVAWSTEVSPALSDLRAALHLDPAARHTRVHDIAMRLELPHLVTFFERVALKGA